MKAKKKALGRGLDAILQSPDTDITSSDISGNYVVGAIAEIELEKIETNPFQPRADFDPEALEELAVSIRVQGIIQPITVRKMGYDQYQLISGERRFRAARIANLGKIPCYIRVANDEQMLEMALIENIHRKDLNAIEIAISYQRLMEECDLTQEKLSERVGKKRATVANYMRLLKLPAEIQLALKEEEISMGHARAIISIEDEQRQLEILQEIINNNLSVRNVEEYVRGKEKPAMNKEKPVKEPIPEYFTDKVEELSDLYETKIAVRRSEDGKGSILITFDSDEDFDRLLERLENNVNE